MSAASLIQRSVQEIRRLVTKLGQRVIPNPLILASSFFHGPVKPQHGDLILNENCNVSDGDALEVLLTVLMVRAARRA